jgi:hypothetical protein
VKNFFVIEHAFQHGVLKKRKKHIGEKFFVIVDKVAEEF